MKNYKKNITFLLPVYNDWKSLNKLLSKLNYYFLRNTEKLNVLIVDDASNKFEKINKNKFSNIKKIKIIRLKKNSGNQKAIFFGLKHLKKINFKGIIIVMDADGEDDPAKIKKLLRVLKNNKNSFIVAARKKRTENFLLKSLNNIRLMLTFIFTGKYINFGNYSCFYSFKLKEIIEDRSLKQAYCATLAKNKIIKILINKKPRYFEKSKASFKFLISHSLNISTVFIKKTIILSIVYLTFISFLKLNIFLNIFIGMIIVYNLITFINFLLHNYFKRDY